MRILVFGIFVSFFFVACGYVEQGVEIKKEYDEYGNLLNETPYKNSKRNGIARGYELGVLQWEIPYKDDKIDGVWKWYYENGNLKVESSYKGGKAEGIAKKYRKNGKLQYTFLYKNNKLVSGECENGKIITSKDVERMEKDGFVLLDDEICP